MSWTVKKTPQVDRQLKRLSEDICAAFALLARELENDGPYRTNWRHYGKLRGRLNTYHCHIAAGRPTYVVCWEIKDKKIHLLEVYYVGTHENAPY